MAFRVREFETHLQRKIVPDEIATTTSMSCTNFCSGSFFRGVGIPRPPFVLGHCRPWRTSQWFRTLSKICSGNLTRAFCGKINSPCSSTVFSVFDNAFYPRCLGIRTISLFARIPRPLFCSDTKAPDPI